jgi:hypothetical protein
MFLLKVMPSCSSLKALPFECIDKEEDGSVTRRGNISCIKKCFCTAMQSDRSMWQGKQGKGCTE